MTVTDVICFFKLLTLSTQFRDLGSCFEDRCKLEIASEYDPAKHDCFLSSSMRSVLQSVRSRCFSLHGQIKVLNAIFRYGDDKEGQAWVHAASVYSGIPACNNFEVSLQDNKIENHGSQGKQGQGRKIKLELLISHRLSLPNSG